MKKYRVVLTNVGWMSPVPAGASVVVYSAYSDKPSHDEVKQAFIDKYGTHPTGIVEWDYSDEF